MIATLRGLLRADRRTPNNRPDRRGARRSAIGLQLQSGLITAAQVDFAPAGPTLRALAECPLAIDADVSETADQLRRLIDAHPFRGSRVVSLLGVQDLHVQSIRVPNVGGEELDTIVRNEAAERLQFNQQGVEIRYLRSAEVRHDDGIRQEVLLLACPPEVIERQLAIIDAAGLSPAAIDLEPAALLRALAAPFPNRPTDDEPESVQTGSNQHGVISLTRDSLSLTLVERGRILFVKHLASGGDALDRAIAEAMDFSLVEGRRLRNSLAGCDQLDQSDDVHRALADALDRPLDAMVRELELCLRYHKITFRRPLASLRLTGCDAAGWIASYFSRRLGTECQLGQLGTSHGEILGQSNELVGYQATRWIAAVGAALRPRRANHSGLEAGDVSQRTTGGVA